VTLAILDYPGTLEHLETPVSLVFLVTEVLKVSQVKQYHLKLHL
tara:strand:+ start:527 stop:658 length:132 start_codon:yes stop_codon:yes gene_type:complete